MAEHFCSPQVCCEISNWYKHRLCQCPLGVLGYTGFLLFLCCDWCLVVIEYSIYYSGTNIAFANARWGYWAILVFCFFFAVTDVWWSLSTPSIFLVQRSPLRMPAGGTGLYWFFDWRNKMACAEAAIANLATEPNRAASAACPHPPPSPKLMSLLFPSHSSGGRGSQSREGTEEGESGVVAITALQHGVMQKRSHRESSPPLMLSFVEV